jgi:hypothetical protein
MNYNRIHGHQYKSASSKALEEWFPGRSQDVWSMVARTFPVCLRTEVPKCQTGSSRTIQNYPELSRTFVFLNDFEWKSITSTRICGCVRLRPFSFVEVCDASTPALPLVTAHSISSDQLPTEGQLSTSAEIKSWMTGWAPSSRHGSLGD